MPAVFVDKPVMKPAEEGQIVQIGGSAFRPVDNVMDLKPVGVVASVEPTGSTVTVGYQSSQPSGNSPTVSSDPDDLGTVGDDGFEDTVTGESLCGLVGNQSTRPQFGDTRISSGQRFEFGEDGYLRWSNCLVSGGGTHLDQPVGHPL